MPEVLGGGIMNGQEGNSHERHNLDALIACTFFSILVLLADPLFSPETLNVCGVFFTKEVFQDLHALPTCRHRCDFTNGVANVTEDIGGMF